MVHALDEVPPIRAAVKDARGFLLVARVEATIVRGTRPRKYYNFWHGGMTHAERSEFAKTGVVVRNVRVEVPKYFQRHVRRIAIICGMLYLNE